MTEVVDPDIGKRLEQPLWMQKFTLWKSMQKSCTASMGPAGIYCSWEGRNCGYSHCPRRIFEEVMMDPAAVPVAKSQPKIRNQIQSLQNENKQQRQQIADLQKRLEAIEAK